MRIRVPDRLRGEIKKGEIWKSLGAVSHIEAARLARIERHNADQLFVSAERALRTAPPEMFDEITATTMISWRPLVVGSVTAAAGRCR